MRCKPGELAIIVRSRKFPEWIGKVVRVTRVCPFLRVPAWYTEPDLFDPKDGGLVVCEDDCLRPIRPDADPVEAETETEREVTA